MIELKYDMPVEGQKRLDGQYCADGVRWFDFSSPIVCNDSGIDIAATEAGIRNTIQEAAIALTY